MYTPKHIYMHIYSTIFAYLDKQRNCFSKLKTATLHKNQILSQSKYS